MGDDGGSQAGWWLGGEAAQKEPKPEVEEGAGGEQAMDTCEGPAAALELHSDALSLENMVMASGKLGGVAGVFLGVHIWGGEHNNTSAFAVKENLTTASAGTAVDEFLRCSEDDREAELLQDQNTRTFFTPREQRVHIQAGVAPRELLHPSTCMCENTTVPPSDAGPDKHGGRSFLPHGALNTGSCLNLHVPRF